jgi:hypothetical protein
MKKAFVLASFIFFLFPAKLVWALDVPTFPTCSNPQGVLKVSFNSGVHGIVGNPGEFQGADHVYTVDDARTVQCFCSSDGTGIQTNWWKVSSLSQDEIQTLKNLGWVFIPTGSVWGLQDAPYMAQNVTYSCNSNSTTSNGGSSSSSSNSGSVLSSSASTSSSTGSVLGLAYTGGAWMVGLLALLSGISVALGFVSRRIKS